MRDKKKLNIMSYIIMIFSLMCSCLDKQMPAHPLMEYDDELASINLIQCDTLANDTAIISIEDLIRDTVVIKDTINYSVKKELNRVNQLSLADKLIQKNKVLKARVETTRGIDTSFMYRFKEIKIEPIITARVLSGNCVGLYDVNYKRDYQKRIRAWMFDKKRTPDTLLINRMNALMKQINYSGWKEYSAVDNNLPIVKTLIDESFSFETDLPGKYFYLISGKSYEGIVSFIKDRISSGFDGAEMSSHAMFKCSNAGFSGPNILFLIGIDDNWEYNILPVGLIVIDNLAPEIYALGRKRNSYLIVDNEGVNPRKKINWPYNCYLKEIHTKVNIPSKGKAITSAVTIRYGHFEGNDYFGYDIPFYIFKTGDIKEITIGKQKISAKSIIDGECKRVHLKSLKIGDNEIKLSATDMRGNTSFSKISIPIVHSYQNNDNDNDNDYDELEGRVNDLEGRINNLEQ